MTFQLCCLLQGRNLPLSYTLICVYLHIYGGGVMVCPAHGVQFMNLWMLETKRNGYVPTSLVKLDSWIIMDTSCGAAHDLRSVWTPKYALYWSHILSYRRGKGARGRFPLASQILWLLKQIGFLLSSFSFHVHNFCCCLFQDNWGEWPGNIGQGTVFCCLSWSID